MNQEELFMTFFNDEMKKLKDFTEKEMYRRYRELDRQYLELRSRDIELRARRNAHGTFYRIQKDGK